MILAGTGTRRLTLREDKMDYFHQTLIPTIQKLSPSEIISGAAEGFDAALAHAAFTLDIPCTLAIPSPTYGQYYWGQNSLTGRNRLATFEQMLERANKVIYVCENHQWGKANFIRNQWMVDHADHFVIHNPANSTGTAHCTRLIKAKALPHTFV